MIVTPTTLPVIIAGAGPCGLVTALTLQRQQIPFVVVERANRKAIASNVGSGMDMAPTAVNILEKRLNLPLDGVFEKIGGMCIQDMQGKILNNSFMPDMTEEYGGTLSRSGVQNLLLDTLFPTPQDEDGVLFCGKGVQSYEANYESVTVTLSDETKIEGRALLGCDGVHSAVRKCMMQGKKDELRFCNAVCYWAKCKAEEGSKLMNLFNEAKHPKSKGGTNLVMALGSTKEPGFFSVSKLNDQLLWTFSMKADKERGNPNGDLTRRGGRVLDAQGQAELESVLKGRGEMIQLCLKGADPTSITRVGVFDRENFKLPYTDGKRVALLGDAAHPQTPFAGQGGCMAITDGYVLAMLLHKHPTVSKALEAFDSKIRRKSVKKVVKLAKTNLDGCVADSWFVTWLTRFSMKLMAEEMGSAAGDYDQSNKDFVATLDKH